MQGIYLNLFLHFRSRMSTHSAPSKRSKETNYQNGQARLSVSDHNRPRPPPYAVVVRLYDDHTRHLTYFLQKLGHKSPTTIRISIFFPAHRTLGLLLQPKSC